MSRRSTRFQGTLASTSAQPIDEDIVTHSDDEDFFEVEEEPEFVPKKKRRKSAKSTVSPEELKLKKVRGRRGILSSLKEFPLDVLFEIFGQLNPKDLINLARTTKELRGILMNRSNAFIWKGSRARVEGLPEIPRDLNEPQYAALAFDGHCHKCLTTPVQTVIWTARMRLCKKCFQEDFVAWNTLEAQVGLERELSNLVPSFEERHRGRRSWRLNMFHSLSFARKLKEETASYRLKGTLQKTPGYSEWLKGKCDEMKEMQAHAKSCAAWLETRKTDRTEELDEARRLRREAIVERLIALGWGEEIPHHDWAIEYHKLVRQPKELTDRIWKNIEAPLVEFLTDLKKKRLEFAHHRIIKERRTLASRVYKKFQEAYPADTIFPPKLDMIRTEPFRTVIEDSPTNPEVKLTEESFDAALLHVPSFSAEWRRSKDQELVELMKKTSPDSTEADLHLATTFFACSTASEAIGYPRILVTSSATAYDYWDYRDEEEANSLRVALREDSWNANGTIRFHEQASLNARAVVEACGLDPDVTTAAEMEEINPAMECVNCYNEYLGRHIMRWIKTTTHSCAPSWRCLKPDDELRVEVQEKEAFPPAPSHGHWVWQHDFCCKFCENLRPTNYLEFKNHFQTKCVIPPFLRVSLIPFRRHNIEQVSLEMLKYSLDASTMQRFPRPLWLKPLVVEAEGGAPSEGVSKEAKDTGAGTERSESKSTEAEVPSEDEMEIDI
ncbi:hypothetical protein C8F04DRAFT_254471 [Mycena alexandri]|uniref:F-box domain-containing protein n=1 Tax=Mycena alexandri TaxID=1745969 RepID=A0AAD6T9N4_9AGAR|nr:hypothetical protein C8F04DRAFT_254471 [Mycena alexandri]